jgi:hypothetical protein
VRTWFTVGVVTLSSLGVFVPSAVLAQHGPDRHEAAAYDATSEATFKGTVVDVKTGRSALAWLFRIHTLGQGQRERRRSRFS